MPTVHKILVAIVLLLFSLSTTAQWYPLSVPPNSNFNGLAVLHEDTLLISEYDTRIFRTYNGGQTWVIDSIMYKTDWSDCGGPHHWDLSDIAAYGPHRITGGQDGHVFVSDDRGMTWYCRYDLFMDYITFQYANEDRIFAFNDGFSITQGPEVFYTDDGGLSWFPQHDLSLLNAIFHSDSVGIACGRGIFRTTNAGASWKNTGADTNRVYLDIWSDGRNTVAAGYDGYMTRSSDSGITWSQPSRINENDIYNIDFFTPMIGVAIAVDHRFKYSYILGSQDSGKTWIKLDSVNAVLRRIDIANDSVGYIVGWPEAVYKTTNAGGLPLSTHVPDKLRPDIRASVFPNPFRNQVVLDISAHSDKVTLFVSDARGRIVFAKTVLPGLVPIDLNYLPQGIYALSIIGENSRKNLRLVKME